MNSLHIDINNNLVLQLYGATASNGHKESSRVDLPHISQLEIHLVYHIRVYDVEV